MDMLFPENLIAGSVKDQGQLNAAFLQYPYLPKAFIAIALAKPEMRSWYEERWQEVRPYLDKDFVKRFQNANEHEARAWELHLAVVLLQNHLPLEKKDWEVGPDFCIKLLSGQRIWIEAISCTLGEAGSPNAVEPMPDMIPGVMYSGGGDIETTNRPKALRITSAIANKFEQYGSYLGAPKSGVTPSDCLIIAVNGSAIQHFSDASILFKRAIFGQGPDVYVRNHGTKKFAGPFYSPKPIISKKYAEGGETEIPANFMEIEEFSKISAVIYCGSRSYDWIYGTSRVGDDFLFGYHSKPINAVPEGLFNFGRAIRKDPSTQVISDKKQ